MNLTLRGGGGGSGGCDVIPPYTTLDNIKYFSFNCSSVDRKHISDFKFHTAVDKRPKMPSI